MIIALLHVVPPAGTAAATDVQSLPSVPGGSVTEVVDGDTVFLSNGVEVRMVGIQAPKLPLGQRDFAKWPLAEEARVTLKSLARGRTFFQYFGGARMDRHGRSLAHLVDTDGLWLQGEMLRLGLARVYTFPDNTALADEMLALEREARRNLFGIWSHPFYALRTPETATDDIGTFQIVEGRVMQAADVRGTIYLNFGEDWRTDFTLMIRRKARKTFADVDPANWQGLEIRARGWLKSRNGPMIEITHAQQIELLEVD